MKRFFLIITAFFPLLSIAQVPERVEVKENVVTTVQTNQRASTIWSEDFAGGFPSTWFIDDRSGICPWTYSIDGSWGYYNGNNGSSAASGINSTSAGNGFLILDTDSANHANYGQPSGTTYQFLESYFITERIDLSSEPAVTLQFEQAYRYNNSVNMLVSVSNDSLNWTDWTVQNNVPNNSHSTDPEMVSLNISSVAGSQDTVYIRVGWNARVYYWMLDDMCIVTAPNDDIKLSNEQFDSYIEYSKVPLQQSQPITFSASLSNEGMNTQNNAFLSGEIFDAGMSSLFSGSSTSTNLAMGSSASATVSGSYLPSVTDTLTVVFKAEQDETDQIPTNDSTAFIIEITDSIFARDNNTLYNQFWMDTTVMGSTQPFDIGNIFEINSGDVASSVSIFIGGNTDIGAPVLGAIHEVVDAATAQFTWLGNTSIYNVAGSDLNDWVTLSFPGGINLDPGKEYLVMAAHPESDSALYVGRSSNFSPDFTCFYKDSVSWYYTNRTPMVRLNLNILAGINNNNLFSNLNIYPNPVSDWLHIDLTELYGSNYRASVTDLSGRLVIEQLLANNGSEAIINVTEIPNGVYLLTLTNETERWVSRIVIH